MMITPITRTQEYVIADDGRKTRRCYGPHNPHYYLHRDAGLFLPIDYAAMDTAAHSTIGDITKKDANIRSIGIRQDLNSAKLFGIRPDFDQSGEYQFEVTPVSLKINNLEGALAASKIAAASSINFDLGTFNLLHNRHFTRFCFAGDARLESFELRLKLDLTGLEPVYRADLDEFWIYTKSGDLFARIREPLLLNPGTLNGLDVTREDLQKLNLLGHDLQQAKDGRWEYTKYSKDGLKKVGVDAYLIDADIYYAGTADGNVVNGHADWPTCHDAATGTSVNTGIVYSTNATRVALITGVYYITRSFFIFDTSGAANPIACTLKIYGYSVGNTGVIVQNGTHADTLTIADFDACSGPYYCYTTPWSASAYNSLPFDAVGISDLNVLGSTKICAREKVYDYDDVSPGSSSYLNGCYYANYTGTTRDPYLEIAEGPAMPILAYYHNQARI